MPISNLNPENVNPMDYLGSTSRVGGNSLESLSKAQRSETMKSESAPAAKNNPLATATKESALQSKVILFQLIKGWQSTQ